MTIRQSIIAFSMLMTIAAVGTCHAEGGESNWYLGVSIGRSSIDENANGIRLDTDATAYRLYGGLDFNQYFGVEAQYVDFGSVDGSATINGVSVGASADANGFALAGVVRVPITETINLTGKLGYLAWDVDATAAGIEEGESDQDVYFGAGGEWKFTSLWSGVAEFERYKLDNVDVNLWSIGARVRF